MNPPPAVIIRPAREQDLYGLACVRPDAALHAERIARQLDGDWVYLVACPLSNSGRALSGFALLIWNGDEYHVSRPVLADIFVRESLRGQGIGTRLIAHAERLCRERSLPCLGLSVSRADNPRAYALYTRLGYRATGDAPHCISAAVTDEHGRFRLHDDWRIALVKHWQEES